MLELIKLLLVFALLVFLINKKIPVGGTLILGAIFLGILFELPLSALIINMGKASIEPATIDLLVTILLILLFGELLKCCGYFQDLTFALENLVKNVKLLLMLIPAIIGLLPMPAGAMMSAPMVEEVGNKYNLSPEIKVSVNYWFRHILELIFPLYQGVIISASILNVKISKIILAQLPLSLAMILSGVLFLNSKIKIEKKDDPKPVYPIRNEFVKNIGNVSMWGLVFKGLWPIILVVLLNLILGINLALALAVTIIFLFVIRKVSLKDIGNMIKRSFSLDIVILILGVMIFMKLITVSGGIEVIPQSLSNFGISPVFAVFLIPFVVGILTGMTSAFVGISYPILFLFLCPSGVNYGNVMLAFGAGFIGVMFSPVHLCLVLTKDYFKANFRKVYFLILPPGLFLLALAIILVLLGFPWGKIG
jgi:integral membrane protein (TIGR00529 family)